MLHHFSHTTPALALTLVALSAGCGASSPEEEIIDVFVGYSRAVLAGDGEAACSRLTHRARRRLDADVRTVYGGAGDGSCESAIRFLSRRVTVEQRRAAERVLDERLLHARVLGNRARILSPLRRTEIELRRVDGVWRFDTA